MPHRSPVSRLAGRHASDPVSHDRRRGRDCPRLQSASAGAPRCTTLLINLNDCLDRTPTIRIWGIALSAIASRFVPNRVPQRERQRGELSPRSKVHSRSGDLMNSYRVGNEPRFSDRAEAGSVLARQLAPYAGRSDVIVLALPRGGVPVGYEVAHALGSNSTCWSCASWACRTIPSWQWARSRLAEYFTSTNERSGPPASPSRRSSPY